LSDHLTDEQGDTETGTEAMKSAMVMSGTVTSDAPVRSWSARVACGFVLIGLLLSSAYLLNYFAGEPYWTLTKWINLNGEGDPKITAKLDRLDKAVPWDKLAAPATPIAG